MKTIKNYIITIDENYMNDLYEIVDLLINNGVNITNIHDYGVIVGDAAVEDIEYIRAYHEKIVSIEEDKQVSII